MKKKLSVSDIEYICNNRQQSSPEDLATAIKKPKTLVKALLELMEVPVKAKEKKHSARAQADERRKNRIARDNKSIYETKPLDLTGQVKYVLNSKTTIYGRPGLDIAKLKKKFNIA